MEKSCRLRFNFHAPTGAKSQRALEVFHSAAASTSPALVCALCPASCTHGKQRCDLFCWKLIQEEAFAYVRVSAFLFIARL